MTDFRAPLPTAAPLEIEHRFEFFGWHTVIASEIEQLLGPRPGEWLSSVALQISEVLGREWTELSRDETDATPSHAQSMGTPLLHPDNLPGEIHDFSALEPLFRWRTDSGHESKPWERYAVFALWKLHDATQYLPAKHGNQDSLSQLMFVDLAASLTIEAMGALQLAQSLRFEMTLKSASGRNAASARHANREAMLDKAVQIA